MSWEQYFEKNRGRPPRPLYLEALKHTTITGQAVDLGFGAGIETNDLLKRGWNVLAIDRERSATTALEKLASHNEIVRLQIRSQCFEEVTDLPLSDFIFAYHALPFCPSPHFERLCHLIGSRLASGGVFAGSFFGMNDEWVQAGHMKGSTSEAIRKIFAGHEILYFEETDRPGTTALGGQKNWHVLDIILRNGSSSRSPFTSEESR